MNTRKMCLYCAKWFPIEEMIPMFEKNKESVKLYCTKCAPEVRHNFFNTHFEKLYSFGKKGSYTEK